MDSDEGLPFPEQDSPSFSVAVVCLHIRTSKIMRTVVVVVVSFF